MKIPKYRKHSSGRGFVEHLKKRTYLPGAFNSPESLEAYRAFVRDYCGAVAPSADAPPEPQSIALLVDAFLAYAEVAYPDPRGTYLNLLTATKPLLRHFAGLPPRDFGPRKLKELQHLLVTQERKLSRQYINDLCRRIKQIFRWAVTEELLPIGIYQALAVVPGIKAGRTRAVERAKRRMVPKDVVEAILPYLSPTVRAMVELQWHTGARSRSLCLARPEQFRLDVLPWEWRPRHKQEHTGAELVVYIGPRCRMVLAPLLAIPSTDQQSDYLFRPQHARKSRRYGKFYTSGSFRQAVLRGIQRANAARAKAGLPEIQRWTPHRVRHSRSTLVREGHGLEAAQAALGHKSIEAAQLYAERQAKEARRIAESEG